jgi:hypothetical protein
LIMKKIAITVTGAAVLAAADVSLAGAAAAVPVGGRADDAINTLQGQGYSVRINGAATAPLSACTVTNVSGLSGTESAAGHAFTAYVDIACPQGC